MAANSQSASKSLGKRKREDSAEARLGSSNDIQNSLSGGNFNNAYYRNSLFLVYLPQCAGCSFSEADGETSDSSSTRRSSVTTPLTPASDQPTKHVRPKVYSCPYEGCGKAFDRPVRLTIHLRSHTDERPFICSYKGCNKSFRREGHLDYHVKNVHLNQKDYVCTWEGCEKAFITATKLRKHQESHQGQSKHQCTGYPPCNEKFRKHTTLQKHVALVHLQQKPFPCTYIDEETGEQCTHAYDTFGRLQSHQGRVHDGPRYWCTICNGDDEAMTQSQSNSEELVGFSTYGELQNHSKRVHPPVCEECSTVFPSQRALRKHVEVKHSGLELKDRKVFFCEAPDCGKTFTRQNNLRAHVRNSHENRRFVCGQVERRKLKNVKNWDGANACGRGFASKAGLEDHVRTQHQGLVGKPRRKEVHNQSSSRLETRHVSDITKLTGAGYGQEIGRDIECIIPACPYRFYRDYDLEIHLGSMHGMQPDEITEAITEYNALHGGQFWIGGIGKDEDIVTQGIRPLESPSTSPSPGGTLLPDSYGNGTTEALVDPQLLAFEASEDILLSNDWTT